jgi:arylformamidase
VKIYDISLSLSPECIRWVTSQPMELIERKRMSRGDANNSSTIHASAHAGTHVDAPFHFVPDGMTIEALPLDLFIGPARVCAVEPGTHITAADVRSGIQARRRFYSRRGIQGCCKRASMIRASPHFPWTGRRRW